MTSLPIKLADLEGTQFRLMAIPMLRILMMPSLVVNPKVNQSGQLVLQPICPQVNQSKTGKLVFRNVSLMTASSSLFDICNLKLQLTCRIVELSKAKYHYMGTWTMQDFG
jgi:hypothetical protein